MAIKRCELKGCQKNAENEALQMKRLLPIKHCKYSNNQKNEIKNDFAQKINII